MFLFLFCPRHFFEIILHRLTLLSFLHKGIISKHQLLALLKVFTVYSDSQHIESMRELYQYILVKMYSKCGWRLRSFNVTYCINGYNRLSSLRTVTL